MSIDIPSPGNSPDESDPLEGLHLGQLDPRLDSIIDEVKKIQSTIEDDDEDVVDDNLERLGDLLEEMGWIGDSAEVTGKLRITNWANDETFPAEFLDKYGLTIQEDERGEYVYVDNAHLLFAAPLVELTKRDGEELHELGAYVFTFTTVDELDEKFGHDERKKADYLATGCKLVMYPDDIEQLDFSSPSLEQIERFLEAHYPKVYQDILELVDIDTGANGERMLRDLKKISISQNLEMSPQTRAWIGGYMYSLVDVDQEAEYEFVLNGLIKGVGVESENPTAQITSSERLRGTIVAFDVNEVTGRVDFIVAELAAHDDGYEGIIVPIDSVTRLRRCRRMRRRFGKIAMMNFELPQDLAKYWHESKTHSDEGKDPTDQGATGNDSDIFLNGMGIEANIPSLDKGESDKAILEAFEWQLSDIPQPEYNPDGNFYEIPLSRDLGHVVAAYQSQVVARDEMMSDDALTTLIHDALNSCYDLRSGDEIITRGNAVVLVAQDLHGDQIEHSVHLVQHPDRIRGDFYGIVETHFPSAVMIESGGEVHGEEKGLGLLLKNLKIVNGTNEDLTWVNYVVVVRIPHDIGGSASNDSERLSFAKIEKTEELGSEA